MPQGGPAWHGAAGWLNYSRRLVMDPKRGRFRLKARRLVVLCTMLVSIGCSVFEPPQLTGGAGGTSGGTGGAGGNTGNTGGRVAGGSASTDSGAGAGTSADGGGAAGVGGSSDSGTGTGGGGSGGTPSTGPFWRTVNEHGCEVAGLPSHADRPVTSDPGEDLPPIYLAQTRIRIGAVSDDPGLSDNPEAWRDIGFDLDGVCTSSATCEVDEALVNEKACANSIVLPFDGNQCRDNEIGKIFNVAASSPSVGSFFGFSERDWNCEMHRGGFSIIYKISGYNGQLNDRNVRVDHYTSIGLRELPAWNCRERIDAPLEENWHLRAPWLPTSRWLIIERSIDPAAPDSGDELPNAKAADPSAYVRNGYLVAQLPPGVDNWVNGQRTPVPGFRLVGHRMTIVAKLERREDQTWAIGEGTVSFVTRPQDVIAGFREIGYCENMCQSYDQVVGYLNTHQDALIGTNELLPDTPCNSLSFGMDFRARQITAKAADVVQGEQPVECPEPRHPDAPRQSCDCATGVGCESTPDGGSQ
jgi:hypothetical protein